MTNKIKVSICNTNYSLVSDNEDHGHIVQASLYVDTMMQSILKENSFAVDREKAAVLTALQCASDLLKQKSEQQNFNTQLYVVINKIDQCITSDSGS